MIIYHRSHLLREPKTAIDHCFAKVPPCWKASVTWWLTRLKGAEGFPEISPPLKYEHLKTHDHIIYQEKSPGVVLRGCTEKLNSQKIISFRCFIFSRMWVGFKETTPGISSVMLLLSFRCWITPKVEVEHLAKRRYALPHRMVLSNLSFSEKPKGWTLRQPF